MTYRILVTGSRTWTSEATIFEAFQFVLDAKQLTASDLILVHGTASGADRLSEQVFRSIGGTVVERYPANWKRYGRRAGYLRNEQMVLTKPDIVLAFQKDKSQGTQHTIDLAHRYGLDVIVYEEVS